MPHLLLLQLFEVFDLFLEQGLLGLCFLFDFFSLIFGHSDIGIGLVEVFRRRAYCNTDEMQATLIAEFIVGRRSTKQISLSVSINSLYQCYAMIILT